MNVWFVDSCIWFSRQISMHICLVRIFKDILSISLLWFIYVLYYSFHCDFHYFVLNFDEKKKIVRNAPAKQFIHHRRLLTPTFFFPHQKILHSREQNCNRFIAFQWVLWTLFYMHFIMIQFPKKRIHAIHHSPLVIMKLHYITLQVLRIEWNIFADFYLKF